MLQEKHFDLIHFGTVTCNTISGKIKLEDSQCWQSETRQKKYEASGLEFKKSQLWITLPNLHTPGACTVILQGKEAKKEKDVGKTYFLPKHFHVPSGWDFFYGERGTDHGEGSMTTELHFGTTRELEFINSFYYLTLLFCEAQSQILYSRSHKVNFPFAIFCQRIASSLILYRSH